MQETKESGKPTKYELFYKSTSGSYTIKASQSYINLANNRSEF